MIPTIPDKASFWNYVRHRLFMFLIVFAAIKSDSIEFSGIRMSDRSVGEWNPRRSMREISVVFEDGPEFGGVFDFWWRRTSFRRW